jgi:hypothetical protein
MTAIVSTWSAVICPAVNARPTAGSTQATRPCVTSPRTAAPESRVCVRSHDFIVFSPSYSADW